MFNRWWIVLLLLVGWPATALAHPGHGGTEPTSLVHYVVEPAHAIPIGLVIAAIVVAGFVFRRWSARGPSDPA
jgi:hypothetical protein